MLFYVTVTAVRARSRSAWATSLKVAVTTDVACRRDRDNLISACKRSSKAELTRSRLFAGGVLSLSRYATPTHLRHSCTQERARTSAKCTPSPFPTRLSRATSPPSPTLPAVCHQILHTPASSSLLPVVVVRAHAQCASSHLRRSKA